MAATGVPTPCLSKFMPLTEKNSRTGRAWALCLAAACLFPPLGHRSAIAALPQLGFDRLPAAQLMAAMNRVTLLQILIEMYWRGVPPQELRRWERVHRWLYSLHARSRRSAYFWSSRMYRSSASAP